MTREEAIKQIKWYFEEDDGIGAEDITKEAIYMAIEALKAEIVQGVGRYENAIQKLQELPRYINDIKERQIKKMPTKADRPKGEWLKVIDRDGILMEYYVCDKCGMLTTDCSDFCPNCGAKMDKNETRTTIIPNETTYTPTEAHSYSISVCDSCKYIHVPFTHYPCSNCYDYDKYVKWKD